MRAITIDVLKEVGQKFSEDKVPRLASAIAYSTIFSIAPLFIVLIAILGWIVGVQHGGHGHRVAEDALIANVSHSAGTSAGETVRQLVASSFNKPRQSIIAQVLGWIAFVVGATAVFSTLQDALNTIWNIESTKGGWKQILRDRSASFGMILIVGFLLLVTFVGSVAVAFIGSHFAARIPLLNHPIFIAIVGQVITFCVITVLFAALYKTLPDVKLSWRDTWTGSIITAVLFLVGEAAITLYLRFAGVASAYGAAGSLLVALLWIYYTALIVLLGAEFTKVLAEDIKTTAPATVRTLESKPAGIDPRT